MAIVGVILMLMGIVFAFQGAGNIQGSFMTGDSAYIYVGSAVAVIGLVVLALGFGLVGPLTRDRRIRKPRSEST